jgi:CD109 antigen
LNQVVRFQIGSMKKITSLSYYVVGRGNVLLSKTVAIEKKNVLVLEFESIFAMLPQCTLVVYYIADDGTIVSDQTEVVFSQELMLSSVSSKTV